MFHRIVPGFVIQGGDPTQSGNGGPGYSTVDTPAQDTTYTQGVVAMGKTASEASGTAGSQFFVVTAQDAGLPPDYAVVGDRDRRPRRRRSRSASRATRRPRSRSSPIVVESVTVVES